MNKEDKLKFSLNVATVAGIFSVTIALLLLLNFLQMARSKPLDSNALIALVQRLNKEPNNDELKKEIRDFDLLARKAYFNTQWQVKTGGTLLLFGAIVLVLALRVYYGLKSKIGEPDVITENEFTKRLLTQRWVMILGIVIFALGLGASFISVDHLSKYEVDETKAGQASADTKGIETIEVGGTPQTVQPASGAPVVKEQA